MPPSPDVPAELTSDAAPPDPTDGLGAAVKARLGALGRRAKRIDLRAKIVAHPGPALVVAASAGALLGFARPRRRARGRVGAALVASVGAVLLRVVREAALYEAGELARQWLERRGAPVIDDDDVPFAMPPVTDPA